MARNTHIPGWTGNEISSILAPMQSTLARAAVIIAFLPGCTFNTEVQVESSADESGDPPGLDSTGDPDPGHTSTSNGSATGQIQTTGSTDTGSVDSSTSGASSDGADSTDSTTGEPAEECILPTSSTTWCGSQLIAAQIMGCSTSANPPACYQTITSQYEVGDWTMVAAADCDTAADGPECGEAIELCYLGTGPNACHWGPRDDAQDCMILATDYGISEQDAVEYCADMAAVWLLGCTTRSAYLACNPACDLPCSHGRNCAGPAGSEVCTEPCGSCDPPLVFGDPWSTSACSDGWCGVECIDNVCPLGYACDDGGVCWPS